MRKLALIASIALGAALMAAPANARPWGDNRLQLEVPNGWNIIEGTHQTRPDQSYVEIAAPDDDCAFYSSDAQIANASVARSAILEDSRFTPEYINQVGVMFSNIIPRGATLTANVIDNSGAWPIRRLTFTAADKVAHVAIQWRPGLQLIAGCSRYQQEASESSRYDGIFRSVKHPNDAAWLAEAQQ